MPMPREERGTVIAVADGVARIRVIPSEACGACELRGRCHETGDGAVIHWPVFPSSTIPPPSGLAAPVEATGPVAATSGDLQAGDTVMIRKAGLPQIALALLVYGLPLVGLMTGATIGNGAGGERGAIVGAAAGTIVSGLIVLVLARIGTRQGWWSATVERMVGA